MKLKKIFWLLLLVSVALALASCGEAADTLDCFDFEDPIPVYDNVYQIDGRIVDSNRNHNVIAVESEEAQSDGSVTKTVTVYDLTTGNALMSDYIYTSTSGDLARHTISANLDEFPVVQIIKNRPTYSSDSGYESHYSYSYSLINTANDGRYGSHISLGESETESRSFSVEKIGNVYLVKLSDALYWVRGDSMQVVHRDAADIANSYISYLALQEYFQFDAEYCGYLYAWQFDELHRNIMVFDTNGVCAVQYNHPNDVITYEGDAIVNPSVFVLNNGNIFVQECTLTPEGENYDFIYRGNQITLRTKIIDYKTGNVTEIDFNSIILDMQSKYDTDAGIEPILPFTLNEGYSNLIVYTPIVDRRITALAEVSVADDEFNVLYTFKNSDLSAKNEFDRIMFASKDFYVASEVSVGDGERTVVYDYTGKIIKIIPETALAATLDFVVLESGIYDWEGNKVYDLANTPLAGGIPTLNEDFGIKSDGRSIYLTYHGVADNAAITYRFEPSQGKFVLFCDGVDSVVDEIAVGYVKIKNLSNDSYSLVNSYGDIILKTKGEMNISKCNDVLYVEATVFSEKVIYVINNSADMPETENGEAQK